MESPRLFRSAMKSCAEMPQKPITSKISMSASLSVCALIEYQVFIFTSFKKKGRHILAGWGGLHFSGRRSDKNFGCVYLDKLTGRVKLLFPFISGFALSDLGCSSRIFARVGQIAFTQRLAMDQCWHASAAA